MLTPFHLAIEVRDVAEARDFYGAKMGLPEGRSDAHWIDFNLFGHQLVTAFESGSWTGTAASPDCAIPSTSMPCQCRTSASSLRSMSGSDSRNESARLSRTLSLSPTSDFAASQATSTPCSLRTHREMR